MQIQVNGAPQEVPPDATVADLLRQLGLDPRRLAVELNLQVASRAEHGRLVLREGDALEIVTLVGGG
jgi:thiamine biosynthesis protein ThiS